MDPAAPPAPPTERAGQEGALRSEEPREVREGRRREGRRGWRWSGRGGGGGGDGAAAHRRRCAWRSLLQPVPPPLHLPAPLFTAASALASCSAGQTAAVRGEAEQQRTHLHAPHFTSPHTTSMPNASAQQSCELQRRVERRSAGPLTVPYRTVPCLPTSSRSRAPRRGQRVECSAHRLHALRTPPPPPLPPLHRRCSGGV